MQRVERKTRTSPVRPRVIEPDVKPRCEADFRQGGVCLTVLPTWGSPCPNEALHLDPQGLAPKGTMTFRQGHIYDGPWQHDALDPS